MVKFTATLLKFDQQGDKTGWTYIEIPADIAQTLKPGNKKSFRVKGKLDKHTIKGVSLIPMGGGIFIMAINAAMRKAIAKGKGAQIEVQLNTDDGPIPISPELLECLEMDVDAANYFNTLAPSHQLYFSRWIESAKTEATKTRRLTQSLVALAARQDYPTMIRSLKGKQ